MLKKLSLQKQLIVIFAIIVALILIVLFPMIDTNLTNVIDEEMYDVLDRSQTDYFAYNVSPEYSDSSKQIYHMTYNVTDNILYPTSTMTTKTAKKLAVVFSDDLYTMIKTGKEKVQDKGRYSDDTIYYQIQKIDDLNYLISVVYSDYSKDLIVSFKNHIIYIFYLAFALVGLILFIWVSSLIKPLKQIRQYINDIKEDHESELNIDRGDEIGIVSHSLIEMKEELDKQNEIKEEMIHNISHDLKTPIALIRTYAQSIKDDVYPYGDKNASLDVIMENTDRLEYKVRSLLYLNRLDYLSGQESHDTCEMKELILHIISQMQVMHPKVDIIVDLDEVIFKGHEEHWRICIENIIENAYRYVKHVIKITLKNDYLEIFNDGEPIENKDPQALFQPYQTGVKGQFGLGLSIVYKTVVMYGYQVRAENQNEGVRFVITKDNGVK